jgi:hypothetical protein
MRAGGGEDEIGQHGLTILRDLERGSVHEQPQRDAAIGDAEQGFACAVERERCRFVGASVELERERGFRGDAGEAQFHVEERREVALALQPLGGSAERAAGKLARRRFAQLQQFRDGPLHETQAGGSTGKREFALDTAVPLTFFAGRYELPLGSNSKKSFCFDGE